MFASMKTASAALLSLGLLAGIATPASADRSGDIAAGVIGGAIVGGIIGNATAQPRATYVERPSYRGCRQLRERAVYLEETGRFERARHAWREYHRCRGD